MYDHSLRYSTCTVTTRIAEKTCLEQQLKVHSVDNPGLPNWFLCFATVFYPKTE